MSLDWVYLVGGIKITRMMVKEGMRTRKKKI